MQLPSLWFLLALLTRASGLDTSLDEEYNGEKDWLGSWSQQQQEIFGSTSTEACEVSHVTAFEMSKGRTPVEFSTIPTHDFELPKIVPMNGTAGEQWEFDGVSEDGLSGFIFGFYRDPNYSLLGSGNLRMYLEIAFADGERFVQIDYPTESTIESCPGTGTRGTWKGDGYHYRWTVSPSMDYASIEWDTPKTKGSVTLRSVAPPRYADGSTWPSDNASLLTVPHFYWVEPIPVAEAAFQAVIEGKSLSWSGIGGHERLWGAFNWLTCLDAMTFVRLKAGPFALTMWEFESWREKGLQVPSVFLAQDGQKIFSSRLTEPSQAEDFFTWRKLYDNSGITGSLSDKATGFVLDLVSPKQGKQWTFNVLHKNVYFEFFLGEGVGGTGYTAAIIGGQVGSQKQWSGTGVTETLEMPERSLILKRNYVE